MILPQFAHNPTGTKVHCRTCQREGYDTNGTGWQETCLRGHAPCPDCGKQLALLKDGSPRRHARCRARGAQ